MTQPTATVNPVVRGVVLSTIVAVAAALAVLLHRNGHTQGDDFALYLRQARSLFDGDIGQVVSDNRFAVLNSDTGFSPIAYPWVWPLLLSPFVHAWGFDYDRLKLVEVATFCLWLVLLHGIVRRRIGWWPATAIVAVFATAPTFLAHTDQLLTEFPHLAAVGLVIWWYDRIRRDATLLTAPLAPLAVLGGLIALAFNVRRESIVLLGVIAVMASYDVVRERADTYAGRPVVERGDRHGSCVLAERSSCPSLRSPSPRRWRSCCCPPISSPTTATAPRSSTTGWASTRASSATSWVSVNTRASALPCCWWRRWAW
jgi:hypothetical protein